MTMASAATPLPSQSTPTAPSGEPLPTHNDLICSHLYNNGYIKGLYADLFLRISSPTNAAVDGIHFKIHRLLAIKSPMLGALMAETEGDQFLPNASLVLQVLDPNVTPEGLGIAIGHLYASYSAAILKNTALGNPVQRAALLKSVLGSASLLRLPDLASIATTLIKAEISLANVSLYTVFVSAGQHVDADYGAALAEIRDTLHSFLCNGMLAALPSDPWEDLEGESYNTLAQVYAGLPFEWLKKIVESRDFDVPSDRERFTFAKKVISIRAAAADKPNNKNGGLTAGEENVLLSFGSDNAGVTLVRKMPKQAPLNSAARTPSFERKIWKADV